MDQVKRFFRKRNDYKDAFESQAGKRVLNHLMKLYKVLEPTYTSNSPHDTSFMEGQRSVVLHILHILKENPQTFLDRIKQGENEQWKDLY